ncbi:MAG: hypothetical protein J0L62_16935, partial [Bacteroidetes bacterium]|nr:hypothetical protein [Bacteroidota bacterium]
MIRFSVLFLLILNSIAYSQTSSITGVPWNTVYKSVFAFGNINSDDSKYSFNANIDRIGMINPNLIFRYSKALNFGKTYQNEFKTLTAIEARSHNKWIRDEIAACESDPSLTFLSKSRVKKFLERWIQVEEKIAPDLSLVTPLSQLDSLTTSFCTYLFYTESLGEKVTPEKDYQATIKLAQDRQQLEMKKLIQTFEANRFDQNYQKLELFLHKSLYSLRSSKGGFQDQKTRIYHLIADCNPDIGAGVTSGTFSFVRGFLLRPDKEASLNNQFILGFGYYYDPKNYSIEYKIPVNYLTFTFPIKESFSSPIWFLQAGYNYNFNPERATFSNLRLDALFNLGYGTFKSNKVIYPIASPKPAIKNFLTIKAENENNSWLYLNSSLFATTHAYSIAFLRFDIGLTAGIQSMKVKINTTMRKSIDQYSDSTGVLIKSSPLSNLNKLETTKTFGGFQVSPLLVIHADIFDFFTLTT